MASLLTGEAMLANAETRLVFQGTISLWTNNTNRSLVIIRNPLTGNEDRMVVESPRQWWLLQHLMQMIEENFSGTPMLEVERTISPSVCARCNGTGGSYDEDGNWLDCKECAS